MQVRTSPEHALVEPQERQPITLERHDAANSVVGFVLDAPEEASQGSEFGVKVRLSLPDDLDLAWFTLCLEWDPKVLALAPAWTSQLEPIRAEDRIRAEIRAKQKALDETGIAIERNDKTSPWLAGSRREAAQEEFYYLTKLSVGALDADRIIISGITNREETGRVLIELPFTVRDDAPSGTVAISSLTRRENLSVRSIRRIERHFPLPSSSWQSSVVVKDADGKMSSVSVDVNETGITVK